MLARLLRYAFGEFLGPNNRHSTFTGRTGPRTQSASQPMSELRAAWAASRKGKTLILGQCQVFDAQGSAGLWDVLDRTIGTKDVTGANTMPWIILTRTRVGISVWPNGKVGLQISLASVQAADQVESILMKDFGAQWAMTADMDPEARARDRRVIFGVVGPRVEARKADAQPPFR